MPFSLSQPSQHQVGAKRASSEHSFIHLPNVYGAVTTSQAGPVRGVEDRAGNHTCAGSPPLLGRGASLSLPATAIPRGLGEAARVGVGGQASGGPGN